MVAKGGGNAVRVSNNHLWNIMRPKYNRDEQK